MQKINKLFVSSSFLFAAVLVIGVLSPSITNAALDCTRTDSRVMQFESSFGLSGSNFQSMTLSDGSKLLGWSGIIPPSQFSSYLAATSSSDFRHLSLATTSVVPQSTLRSMLSSLSSGWIGGILEERCSRSVLNSYVASGYKVANDAYGCSGSNLAYVINHPEGERKNGVNDGTGYRRAVVVCKTQTQNVTCSTNSQCGTDGYIDNNVCNGNSVYRNYRTFTCNNPGTANSSCSSNTEARLQTTCANNQTCSNGNCTNVTIACSSNSDCGSNSYIGNNYCNGNSIYRNFQTWTCNNPGTANSFCSSSTAGQLQSACANNQTCSGGTCITNTTYQCSDGMDNDNDGATDYPNDFSCSSPTDNDETNPKAQCQDGMDNDNDNLTDYPQDPGCTSKQDNDEFNGAVTCSTKSQCGTDGYIDNNVCNGNSVYRNYKTWTCNNPGTTNSSCTSNTVAQLQTTCASNQTCNNGSCTNVTIACSSNSDCGSNSYIGSNFCNGNSIYRNFQTWTCNNAGTGSSYCSSSTAQQLQQNCTGNQTCNGGVCNTTVTPCTSHASYRCSGNGVYWFNSCGVQEELYQACTGNQTCPAGGNACVNQAAMTLSVITKVRNLSSGNLVWASSVAASPSDVVQYNITIQNTHNQAVNNVTIKDTLPYNLIYNNSLLIDGVANNGNVTSGINLGTIAAGQTKTVTYQVQVAGSQYFSLGTVALNNAVMVTSTDSGFNPVSSSASVIVTKTQVGGATDVPTGLTSYPWIDSIVLPLMVLAAALYFFRSYIFGKTGLAFAGKVNSQKSSSLKALDNKIAEIKAKESK
ncbi:MAG: hypothetical protein Q7S10_02995 [bacterium]|nr:hypothetical protein [bacterium]